MSIKTLSGRIGKEVASHAEGWKVDFREVAVIYTIHDALGRYFSSERGCDQSIGSTGSDAIVHSWLWSTETRSSHWVTSVDYCPVVDNWPHILWLYILHGRLQAIVVLIFFYFTALLTPSLNGICAIWTS